MVFSPYVSEQVGWYVYALRNPIDGCVFYIGKGKGNRVFHHAKNAQAAADDATLSPKLDLINDIHAQGLEVESVILRHGLRTEQLAYEVEAAVIDTLELLDPALDNERFRLTNLVKGHHHARVGKAGTAVVASLFEAEPLYAVDEPMVLFNIPKLWTPAMSDAELYEATHGWWVLGERALRARFAAGVHRNVIRGVYRIKYWRDRVEGDRDWKLNDPKRRIGFQGDPAPEMAHFLGKSVKHLPTGGSVRYLNCDTNSPALTSVHRGGDALAKAHAERAEPVRTVAHPAPPQVGGGEQAPRFHWELEGLARPPQWSDADWARLDRLIQSSQGWVDIAYRPELHGVTSRVLIVAVAGLDRGARVDPPTAEETGTLVFRFADRAVTASVDDYGQGRLSHWARLKQVVGPFPDTAHTWKFLGTYSVHGPFERNIIWADNQLVWVEVMVRLGEDIDLAFFDLDNVVLHLMTFGAGSG